MTQLRRVDLVLLLVAAVWGSSYLAAKDASAALPVVLVLLMRYAMSAAGALLVVAAQPGRPSWTRREIGAGAVLGCTQAAVLVVETYGVAHTSAANAGVLISLTILLTPLLDRRGSGSALPGRFYGAIGIALVGIGMLVGGVQVPRSGDLLILAAAVIRAFHVVLIGRLAMARTARPAQLTAAQTVIGTLLLMPVALPRVADLSNAGGGTWGSLVYLALGCSVFAFVAQTWAVQRSSASRASLLLGTEPVWALLGAVALGGEQLTTTGVLGALLVVTGTYWGQAVERAHRTTKEARPCRAPIPSPA